MEGAVAAGRLGGGGAASQRHAGFDSAGRRRFHGNGEVRSATRRSPLALRRCRHANCNFSFFLLFPGGLIFFFSFSPSSSFFLSRICQTCRASRPAGQIQPTASCYPSGESLKDIIKKRDVYAARCAEYRVARDRCGFEIPPPGCRSHIPRVKVEKHTQIIQKGKNSLQKPQRLMFDGRRVCWMQ